MTTATRTEDTVNKHPLFSINWKVPALTTAVTASLLAQSTAPAPQVDPFAHHDAAKVAAARNPLGLAHLRHAMMLRGELGATSDDTFEVINATTDDMGGVHVRLQQYFKGVKVVNGQVISHLDARGTYGPFTNALKTRINIRTEPGLTKEAALAALARVTGPTDGETATPKVQLVILPVMERYLISTGMPLEPPRPTDSGPVLDKPTATTDDGRGVETPADPINAELTARRVKEYKLAYEVCTAQGHEGNGGSLKTNLFHVDANTGEILRQRSLESSATFVGKGNGKFNQSVTFNTVNFGSGFTMYDSFRNYSTLDADHPLVLPDPVNIDSDNLWGDGSLFNGDALADAANRQTAMVDGTFGSRVYWDLMNNVFKRKGPDNNFYDVNVFAHVGKYWDDAQYSTGSGNISLGDGLTRQALDCLGHENGHALNDFTADLGGSGEDGGLNESNSDIWGAMTTFYLKGGGFAVNSSTIPGWGGSWVSKCSARNMQRPSANKQPDYWFPSIDSVADEHDAAAPNNRAFYFLSQGASAVLDSEDNSTLLPWGMTGLGTHKAAQIWYDAFTGFLPSDADYADTRLAVMLAATFRFGPASAETQAVQNAYAAVNVGTPVAAYPAMPPVISEKEPNNTPQSAMAIVRPNAPKPAGVPDKLRVLGGGKDDDFYAVQLNAGEKITVRLEPGALTDYDLQILDSSQKLLVQSVKAIGSVDQIPFKAPSKQTYYVRVLQYQSKTQLNVYQLYFDFQ